MNKLEKIEAIYSKIADKTKSFGCKVKFLNYFDKPDEGFIVEKSQHNELKNYDDFNEDILKKLMDESSFDLSCRGIFRCDGDDREHEDENYFGFFRHTLYRIKNGSVSSSVYEGVQPEIEGENYKNNLLEIIGHPVMIGDCDKLIEKGPDYFEDWIPILDLWIKKDKPIEDQTPALISFVFGLISNNK